MNAGHGREKLDRHFAVLHFNVADILAAEAVKADCNSTAALACDKLRCKALCAVGSEVNACHVDPVALVDARNNHLARAELLRGVTVRLCLNAAHGAHRRCRNDLVGIEVVKLRNAGLRALAHGNGAVLLQIQLIDVRAAVSAARAERLVENLRMVGDIVFAFELEDAVMVVSAGSEIVSRIFQNCTCVGVRSERIGRGHVADLTVVHIIVLLVYMAVNVKVAAVTVVVCIAYAVDAGILEEERRIKGNRIPVKGDHVVAELHHAGRVRMLNLVCRRAVSAGNAAAHIEICGTVIVH